MHPSTRLWLLITALPALSSCVASQGETAPVAAAKATITAPETSKATCTPSGLKLSSRTVTATAAGVRILVSSSAPGDLRELQLGWWRPRRRCPPTSDDVDAVDTTWRTTCLLLNPDQGGGRAEHPHHRPRHHWALTTMTDLNCPPGVTSAWATPGPGHGPTAQAAVEHLLSSMKGNDWTKAGTRPPEPLPREPAGRQRPSTRR